MRNTWKDNGIFLSLTLIYFISGKLGLTLAFVHQSATAVWPTTGIALVAFLFLGYRVWPAIFLGAFLTNITTAGNVVSSLGIAAGNTLEGLLGAYLLIRFAKGKYSLREPRQIWNFVILAGLASTMVSATFGVTSLTLAGFAKLTDFAAIWITWWLGDIGGVLIFAPSLILWLATNPKFIW